MTRIPRIVFLALVFSFAATLGLAQSNAPTEQPPTAPAYLGVSPGAIQLKFVPVEPTRVADGATTYRAYCASCHGTSGRGDGPAAAGLTQPVPDLTRIAARDGGFNRVHVQLHVTDETMHRAMPDWQSALSSLYSDQRTQLAVHNVTRYLETMQTR